MSKAIVSTTSDRERSNQPSLNELRRAAFDDLFVIKNYRSGKNSFVEAPDRHVGVWKGKGSRYTLAQWEGQGSLRHIWMTRREGDPYHVWEFFVDGESEPSIRGTLEELIDASRQVKLSMAPANFVPVDKRAYNFYLPIPFEHSLRIDVVQRLETFPIWFCQLDYRLNDSSSAGVRLFSRGEGENLTLGYVGANRVLGPSAQPPETQKKRTFEPKIIAPGEETIIANISNGPAIVRELRLQWSVGAKLRLLIRYDDAGTFAVDSPVERFFGPFRGASFLRHADDDASCHLPMPFRKSFELVLRNEGETEASASAQISLEPIAGFSPLWGYFHALHQRTTRTNGHRLHQVLYLRGRGHWVGMSLYETGHDHGGGDFAVIDGESSHPAFLHGINGEDYFTFAWFGKGSHHPYAVAHENEEGRYRHHVENVYPFRHSIAIEWGAFANLSPESVAVWYQDSPEDTSVKDGAREDSVEWDVFGPVPIPYNSEGESVEDLFAVLPTAEELDAGKTFPCRLVKESFSSGWRKDWSVGPMLNLSYIARHGTQVAVESELGGMGHAFLARRFINSDSEQKIACIFAHDDPIEVYVNDICVYRGGQHFNGFESVRICLPLRCGLNEITVRLSNYHNRNFNWVGFLLLPLKPLR